MTQLCVFNLCEYSEIPFLVEGSEELKTNPKIRIYNNKFYELRVVKILKRVIGKIIFKHDNGYLVELLKSLQVNYGAGPTIPSKYIFLRNDFKICPIASDKKLTAEELKEFSYMFDVKGFDGWTHVEQDECDICMNANKNIYAYCDAYHIVCCEQCVVDLKTCPYCQNGITNYSLIEFI